MIRLLRRFFDDIHRIANVLSFSPTHDVLVSLSTEDRDLLAEAATNYRRNKTRVKKETV